MKYISIDIETSGLDPKRDQILQFGAVVVEDTTGEILKEIELTVLHERIHGDPFALGMNADIIKRIAYGVGKAVGDSGWSSRSEGFCWAGMLYTEYSKFVEKEKLTPAGKNFGSFDKQFLLNLDVRFGNLFVHREINPTIWYWNRETDARLPDLQTCAVRAGLVETVSHSALADAKLVAKLITGAGQL